jgi:glycosyltransferase involved in cell wall biosynthesis
MSVSYSVIIPAFNEQNWLPKTLDALQKAMGEIIMPGEIIVADNNSDDKTPEIAIQYGAKVVFEPVNQISRARNAGAKVAKGKYLIFLDADTLISPMLLKTALNYLESGLCCGGGGRVAFEDGTPGFAKLSADLWNVISVRFGMAAGCFIYCPKEAYDATGGFDEKVYASEEIWFSKRLQAWGKPRGMDFRIIGDPPLITSGRKSEWFSPMQMIGMFLIFCFFPFAMRFRSLCDLWYKRPNTDLPSKYL